MFYGRFVHNIDAKGRLTVPASYRDETPGGIFVTWGMDGNLMAFAKDKYSRIADSLNSLSITDPESRTLRRRILGNTAELTFDTAGRVLIPTYLRNYAHIDSDVVIVGMGDFFEIWDPDRLIDKDDSGSDLEADSSRFAAFNINTRGQ
jgi:MraZ protein